MLAMNSMDGIHFGRDAFFTGFVGPETVREAAGDPEQTSHRSESILRHEARR